VTLAPEALTGRRAGLPFAVPEPVPALDGGTVAETPAGPATLCPWLPGVRPDLAGEPALEHQVTLLETAAARVEGWRSRAASELPVQVVHGDLGSSNLLADERTGQVAAVLDFEIAGADFRVQDLVAALLNSGVLDGPDWARRTAALLRGHASALRLTEAEIQAVPDLLLTRAVGSVLWRAGRWRRGQAQLGDVTDRLHRLETMTGWLAGSGQQLVGLAGRRSAGSKQVPP
jgi:homoserine kinase type II